MSDSATFNMTFSTDITFQTEMTQIVEVAAGDHGELPDQGTEDQQQGDAATSTS
jgi:hypothetical protein